MCSLLLLLWSVLLRLSPLLKADAVCSRGVVCSTKMPMLVTSMRETEYSTTNWRGASTQERSSRTSKEEQLCEQGRAKEQLLFGFFSIHPFFLLVLSNLRCPFFCRFFCLCALHPSRNRQISDASLYILLFSSPLLIRSLVSLSL